MSKEQLRSMGLDDSEDKMKEIWQYMNIKDSSEYKLMIFRIAPQTIRGTKISGYLETFHLPVTIPDVIEKIGEKYGGGKYQIRIVDGAGKYVKAKMFEIAGLPNMNNDHFVIPSNSQKTESSGNYQPISQWAKKLVFELNETLSLLELLKVPEIEFQSPSGRTWKLVADKSCDCSANTLLNSGCQCKT